MSWIFKTCAETPPIVWCGSLRKHEEFFTNTVGDSYRPFIDGILGLVSCSNVMKLLKPVETLTKTNTIVKQTRSDKYLNLISHSCASFGQKIV